MMSSDAELRLLVREEEGKSDNLFARLSLKAVSRLYSRAKRNLSASLDNEFQYNSWSLGEKDNIDCSTNFLPLLISFRNGTTIYASYNGGCCEQPSISEQEVIELPRSLISSESGEEIVLVRALSCVEYGVRVLVEPETVEDWELLEMYGDFMEEGGLLNQVSVIYPNQTITLRIGDGNDRVRIRVVEATGDTNFNRNGISTECLVWPELPPVRRGSSSNRDNEDESRRPPCVLLIQDTEVIVTPKPRPSKNIPSWSSPLQLIPSDIDWGTSFSTLLNASKRNDTFRVEPSCVLIHHDQWPYESEWAHIQVEHSISSDRITRIVRVTTSSRIPRKNAVLFIGTRLDLNATVFLDYVKLRPSVSPREVSLNRILLDEFHLEYRRTNFEAWNTPEGSLVYPNLTSCNELSFYCQNGPLVLPIGAVIPTSSPNNAVPLKALDHWSRITLEAGFDSDSDERFYVKLYLKDILCLRKKKRPQRFSRSAFATIAVHSSNLVPDLIQLSLKSAPLDSTIKILDLIQFSCSTFTTLSGLSGTGKTHYAILFSMLISFCYHRPVLYLDCRKLHKMKPKMKGILEEIDLLFTKARQIGNVIIILDDLDKLAPNLSNDATDINMKMHSAINPIEIDQSKLIADRIAQFLQAADSGGCDPWISNKMSLIATCSDSSSLNPSILEGCRATPSHYNVPVLSSVDRADLLIAMIRRHLMTDLDIDRSSITQCIEGFLPCDLVKLSLRVTRSFRKNPLHSSLQDLLVSELEDFTCLSKLVSTQDKRRNKTSLMDIGGLFHVKKKLQTTIHQPVLYKRIYERTKMHLPRGILLFGPSGCGKSFIVPALAREYNYSLVTCKGPEILDKYIGGSEANVRDLFNKASQMAPSILFLDELVG